MNGTPRLLGGRYQVGELIGRGGMAEVHAGHDARLGRTVAIKMLRSDLARDPAFLARFRREAQSAAGLNHPAIVAVYDSGEDHDTDSGGGRTPVPFIVMEYVRGHTLREVLTSRRTMDTDEASRMTEGVLDALAYSHRMGIVHRDIKPANVMVTESGDVKVMDFGIARAIADTSATMTQTQSVIGTAQYLSPEQAQGNPVDARSDLYSTGCLLYELLTGRTPFVGDSPVSIAYQHVRELPTPPSHYEPGIPPDLDAVVMHALAKDREARYQSAEDFRIDLTAARMGRPISMAARGTAAAALGATTALLPTGTATEVVPPMVVGRDGNTASLPAIGHDPADEPRKRHVATYALLTLAVIAALVLIGLAGRALLSQGQDAPTFPIPNVINMTQDQATAKLRADGFNPIASTTPNQADKGIVVDQTPSAGERLPADGTVTITVSSGPDQVQVPDVTNYTQASAVEALKAVGLAAGEVKAVDDKPTFDKGYVVETSPKAGESVATGSSVILNVSSGKVTVPDVVGLDRSVASQKLTDAKLRTDTSFKESTAAEGTVLSQTQVNKKVDVGTVIKIVVAQPSAPTPTTSSTSSTSTTTTPPPTSTSSTTTTP